LFCADTDRNDLYLTIERGEFERGSKTAQKNIETRVLVITKEGQHIEVSAHVFGEVSTDVFGLLLKHMYNTIRTTHFYAIL